MDDGLVQQNVSADNVVEKVLILIIVEDGLVQQLEDQLKELNKSLNPYCNGRWSRTGSSTLIQVFQLCLNPCCSGQWSRTKYAIWRKEWQWCLNPCCNGRWSRTTDLIMATVIVNSS